MRSRDDGFTLLELLIVLAIMGAMIGIVVSRGPARSQGLETRAAAGALAQALRMARAQAIERSEDVTVAIDPAHHAFAADNGVVRALAPGMDISVVPPTLPGPNGTRLIRFSADGSASGGSVILGRGKRRLRIDVEWLTGRVKVANAE
jgi:general secretion pathway protein H